MHGVVAVNFARLSARNLLTFGVDDLIPVVADDFGIDVGQQLELTQRSRRAADREKHQADRVLERCAFAGFCEVTAAWDERDAVRRMLGELNEQQRAALVLTSLLGYSSDEAGTVLGMRGSTVRVLTTRARATLRRERALPR